MDLKPSSPQGLRPVLGKSSSFRRRDSEGGPQVPCESMKSKPFIRQLSARSIDGDCTPLSWEHHTPSTFAKRHRTGYLPAAHPLSRRVCHPAGHSATYIQRRHYSLNQASCARKFGETWAKECMPRKNDFWSKTSVSVAVWRT